ncbi:hypothetical protein M514_01019 [Trichuris suis]|uniref:Uncharacterized protein n=1 Tax=Trichuris suis TaxID=68888 RepID=A0A085MM10_9BILA|nr:hypothetical protein M513_01019 [Trichuris suis]KFD70520.1 hypothetical protein M514_01019 [Trichuris suis]
MVTTTETENAAYKCSETLYSDCGAYMKKEKWGRLKLLRILASVVRKKGNVETILEKPSVIYVGPHAMPMKLVMTIENAGSPFFACLNNGLLRMFRKA